MQTAWYASLLPRWGRRRPGRRHGRPPRGRLDRRVTTAAPARRPPRPLRQHRRQHAPRQRHPAPRQPPGQHRRRAVASRPDSVPSGTPSCRAASLRVLPSRSHRTTGSAVLVRQPAQLLVEQRAAGRPRRPCRGRPARACRATCLSRARRRAAVARAFSAVLVGDAVQPVADQLAAAATDAGLADQHEEGGLEGVLGVVVVARARGGRRPAPSARAAAPAPRTPPRRGRSRNASSSCAVGQARRRAAGPPGATGAGRRSPARCSWLAPAPGRSQAATCMFPGEGRMRRRFSPQASRERQRPEPGSRVRQNAGWHRPRSGERGYEEASRLRPPVRASAFGTDSRLNNSRDGACAGRRRGPVAGGRGAPAWSFFFNRLRARL